MVANPGFELQFGFGLLHLTYAYLTPALYLGMALGQHWLSHSLSAPGFKPLVWHWVTVSYSHQIHHIQTQTYAWVRISEIILLETDKSLSFFSFLARHALPTLNKFT